MNKVIPVAVTAMVMGAALAAQAQTPRQNLEKRVIQLERQNQRQANRLQKLNERLLAVEDYLSGGGGNHPPGGGDVLGIACLLIDTGNGGAHVGKGASKLDAEYEAHKACEKDTIDSYCSKGKLECEPITSYSQTVCMLTDKGFGRRHRGEGDNEVLAKAAAIKQCNADTIDSYCVDAAIQCEQVY